MFVTPNTTTAPATNNASGKDRAPKTTLAYVNFYLPLRDGSRVKLFSDLTLRLYAEKTAEAKVIELIRTGVITEQQLAKMIVAEISLARDENAEIEFDLSQFGI